MLWPVGHNHLCGILAPRATVHAIEFTFTPGTHRAVCGGVDVQPFTRPVYTTDGHHPNRHRRAELRQPGAAAGDRDCGSAVVSTLAVDLFSGAGGASIGIAAAGHHVIGFELDPDACATHHAAGHDTVRADLSTHPLTHLRGRVALLHGSPPCQPFSVAGDGAGADDTRDGMPWMLAAIESIRAPLVTIENVPGLTFARHRRYFAAFLAQLRSLGYLAEWHILNAADFGVPQTRRRLIIVARNDGVPIRWPNTTHCKGGGLFLAPWVSMTDALGWDAVAVGEIRGAGMTERHGTRRARPATGPAPTVCANNRGKKWRGRSAPTVCGSRAPRWVYDRPATSINGDPRVGAPGRHDPKVSGSQQAGAVRVTVAELATLQGFPPGYPFVGNKTSRARQIGNALPSALIRAVVEANSDRAAA